MFPSWLLPKGIDANQIVLTAGKFYTIALNIGVMFMILSAGYATVQIALGFLEENPQKINESRSALFSAFITIGFLAMFQILLTVFNQIFLN